MGSSTMIDIISSFLISGILLLVALRMNERAIKNTYYSEENLTVQQNMTSLVESLEYDFRKIGYCRNATLLRDPSRFIQYGDTNSISFLTDVNNDGNVDTVKYWLGNNPILGCQNPNARMLYRQVDNGPAVASNLGITEFHIAYFNTFGGQLSTPFGAPNQAQVIRITIMVQPAAAYDTTFATNFSLWQQTRLVSRNLKR